MTTRWGRKTARILVVASVNTFLSKKSTNSYIFIIFLLVSFSYQLYLIAFSQESEWQQDSSSLQNPSKYPSCAVIWMVSILSQISRTSSNFFRFLKIVPRAPTMIIIIVPFMFHSFSTLWQGPGICSAFCLYSLVCWNDKIHLLTSSFLLVN